MNNSTSQLSIKSYSTFIYAGLLHSIKNIKISFIIGSNWAFFGAAQMISPVAGFFASSATVALIFILRTFLSCSFSGLSLIGSLFYHIPTLAGTLYLSERSKIARCIIPALCMLAFVVHPIGNQASMYALYWLIPIALAFVNIQSIFLKSLGSTFVTHATGSLLFLYTKNLTAMEWNALISVVWSERLLFALGMTAVYYGALYAYKSVNYLIIIACNKRIAKTV